MILKLVLYVFVVEVVILLWCVQLHQSNYDTGRALQALVKVINPKSIDKRWSDDDAVSFHLLCSRWHRTFLCCRRQQEAMKASCLMVIRPSVCSFTPVSRWCNIALFSEGISVKLVSLAYIHHVSGHCWKGFQGQRSKVKVTVRPDALWQQRLTFRRCGIEARLFTFLNDHLSENCGSIWEFNTVGELSGNWRKVWDVSGKSYPGKLRIANFTFRPCTSRLN